MRNTEIVARLIHDFSLNSRGQFIAQNIAAIPFALIETELFGSERGAYTDAVTKAGLFERAEYGTLFLDEIGELDINAQVKLLRSLEGKEFFRVGGIKPIPVNTRIITATNRNLLAAVEKTGFRRDLFDRINTLPVIISPAVAV